MIRRSLALTHSYLSNDGHLFGTNTDNNVYRFQPTHEFKVEMTCTGCSGAVERVLGKLKGKQIANSWLTTIFKIMLGIWLDKFEFKIYN